jgi:uncharacterized membrane protein YkvA (DUF1232 family)
VLRWIAIGLAGVLAAWALVVVLLLVAGRRAQARALARLVPDCLVLLGRIVRDPRVGRTDRAAILLVLAYLALPFDLIPDFIPVAGQLDDAIIVALLIRRLRRTVSREIVREHWPGSTESLSSLLRLIERP